MDLCPFSGWRYQPDSSGDISPMIAPPYDILSAAQRDSLLAASDRNVVRIDLPHFPPGDAGPDSEYQSAADALTAWQADGTLIQESAPALYAYRQTYTWAGKTHARRALLAGVRATPLGKDVIPHEHTFAGPKADRLKLTQFTRTQLSPIFGFFDDPAAKASTLLWNAVADRAPDAVATIRGVCEELWAVTDEETIAAIRNILAPVPVYIADGHHRYTTAMNYADTLRAEGKIDSEHPANFVMFALVAADDPGLVILPTHRMFSGLAGDFSLPALVDAARQFTWQRCNRVPADLADADAFLAPFGRGAMAFADARDVWVATLSDDGAMTAAAPDQCDAWRSLDVAVLQTLIVEQALAQWKPPEFNTTFTPDGNEAVSACTGGEAQLVALLQGTTLQQVQAVANAGQSMPHKSTYFYPKLTTGMVLKPLE